METLKVTHHVLWIKIIWGLILLSVISCDDSHIETPLQSDSISYSNDKETQLVEFLNQIDSESGILIVPNNGSIQEAVNAANQGDAIYIESGIYKESITINKSGIKLIGLSNSVDNSVILENSEEQELVTPVLRQQSDLLKSNRRRIAMARYDLGSGIAHYTFDVPVGKGKFDIVRLHRVIREHRPYHPIRSKSDIFMVHGSIQDFDDIFLTAGAENINAQTSSPVYLASKNIDVWGIDLAWTRIPAETTDFTFMKNWGIEKDIDHILSAMSIARLIRAFTNYNFGKINLLGFSYSVVVNYGAAGRETKKHPLLRNIKGLVQVDHAIKYAPSDEEFRMNACNKAVIEKELIDSGDFVNNGGVTFGMLSNLAINSPNDPSPIPDFAGMTNKQVMLFMGTSTYLTGNPAAPFWHFTGGNINDLYYTDETRWLKLTASLAPYQPRLQGYEIAACLCNEIDVSFDDHIGDITVPIFYLGAGGGMGALGEYSSSLTASTDITNYTASIPDTDRAVDYGHGDLFLGTNADKLVWEKLYSWIKDHSK